ncbi:hypothetical protein ES705_25221 [subsurface metagenome]
MKNWILPLVKLIMEQISEPLHDALIKFANEFREKARQTPNQWDDFAADIICWLLGIP